MPHRHTLIKGDKIQISNDIYTIERLLSRGGTSLIYEAYRPYCNNNSEPELEESNQKPVIIKELAPFDIPFIRSEQGIQFSIKDTEELEDIFKNEIQNISRIQRHNYSLNRISEMDAFGSYHGTMYIALNHIKGELMSDYIRKNLLRDQEIIDLFIDILQIVQKLHNMEPPYLHLDLKPSNFIIDDTGLAYLFDFGSSLLVNNDWVRNYTERYSAPEIIYNRMDQVGKSSDIYSLGAILYEMVTGRMPDFEKFLLANGRYYLPGCGRVDFNSVLKMMLTMEVQKRAQDNEEVLLIIKGM